MVLVEEDIEGFKNELMKTETLNLGFLFLYNQKEKYESQYDAIDSERYEIVITDIP